MLRESDEAPIEFKAFPEVVSGVLPEPSEEGGWELPWCLRPLLDDSDEVLLLRPWVAMFGDRGVELGQHIGLLIVE